MSDDNRLKQAVLDALNWEPSINAAHIGVTAKDGIVTLMGHVETYSEKVAAEKAARRVKAVKAIAEELEVRLPIGVTHGDEEIAAAAFNRIRLDSTVPNDAIDLKVENGWVTLSGEVNRYYQKEAVADDIRVLWGVVGVSNDITIKPVMNMSKIKDDIIVAFDRWWFSPATITVTAQGGAVKLGGTVKSLHERDEASTIAWAAPGTTSVENHISVV
jgi:osmotically-inducible protein OsmY